MNVWAMCSFKALFFLISVWLFNCNLIRQLVNFANVISKTIFCTSRTQCIRILAAKWILRDLSSGNGMIRAHFSIHISRSVLLYAWYLHVMYFISSFPLDWIMNNACPQNLRTRQKPNSPSLFVYCALNWTTTKIHSDRIHFFTHKQ